MSRFNPEERDEILRTQLEHLADAERAGASEEAEADSEFRGSPAWIEQMLGPSDPLEKWRHEQLKLEAERAQYRERTAADINAENTAGWNRFVRSHIANALDEYDRNLTEVLGQVVAEERHSMRKHVAAELAKLRTELVKQRGLDDGDVVDLAAPGVVRKVKDSSAA